MILQKLPCVLELRSAQQSTEYGTNADSVGPQHCLVCFPLLISNHGEEIVSLLLKAGSGFSFLKEVKNV